jgi:hypothetical protein
MNEFLSDRYVSLPLKHGAPFATFQQKLLYVLNFERCH